MAEIDIWMPWHIAEYLADTMHLSTLEHGAYLLILGHGWRNDGTIVANDAHLAGVTRLPKDQWKTIRPIIERFFEVFEHPSLGACWRQKRQVEEILKAKSQKAGAFGRTKNATEARRRLRDEQRDDERNVDTRGGKGKGSSDLPPEGIAYRLPVRSQEAVALAAQQRSEPLSAKQEFWGPLCQIFGLVPRTQDDELRLYQQCQDFRLKGATVSELERRAGIYQLSFPTVAFTPKAVLSNWDNLKDPPKPKTFGSSPAQKKAKAL